MDWINAERIKDQDIITVFNPTKKQSDYSKAYFKAYIDALRDYALLTNLYKLLLSTLCTIEWRENIEYTICKFFNIHYSEFTKAYIQNQETKQ